MAANNKTNNRDAYTMARDSVLIDMALVILSSKDMDSAASVYYQASLIKVLIEKGLLASGIKPEVIDALRLKSMETAEKYINESGCIKDSSIRSSAKKSNIGFDYL